MSRTPTSTTSTTTTAMMMSTGSDFDDQIQDYADQKKKQVYPIKKLSDLKNPILKIVREMGIEIFGDDQVRGMYIFGSQAYFAKMRVCESDFVGESTTMFDEHGNQLISLCYRNDDMNEAIQYLADSDFDIILVVDDYKSEDKLLGALASDMQSKWETSISVKTCFGEEKEFDLDISVYNTKYFISYMHYHQPVYNQSVTSFLIDEVYVVHEDEKMKWFRKNWCLHHLSIPRLIEANADELDYCFEKSKRFFTLSQGASFSDEREKFQDAYNGYFVNRTSQSLLKTAKKNFVHARRKLFFFKQMLAHNEIVDYAEMNNYQDLVFAKCQNFYNWTQYEKEFLPEFEKLERDFRTICTTIIDFALMLLNNQTSAVEFLNTFCIPNEKCNSRLKQKLVEASKTINNKCLKITKPGEMNTYFLNLFMNGIYFLVHLAGMRVLPFEANDSSSITNATLFQCSIPSNIDNIHPHLMALDGSIIKFEDEKYTIVSNTWGKIVDLRGSTILPRFNEYLYCFKLPYGKKVSLFYNDSEWKVSCPELDSLDWIDWPLKEKRPSWREEFWKVWKDHNIISLEDQQKEATLLFIWNENQLTLIGKFGTNESILKLSSNNRMQEHTELTSYIQEGFSLQNWKQSMIEESLKLNPKEHTGFLFFQENGKVVYHLSSPLHYLIPRLKLANKFYSGVDVLNKDVIEDCTDFALLQNKENDSYIISCAVLADYYGETTVEDCFRILNPLFRSYYLMARKEVLKHENKEHIPLLKQAALTLEFNPTVEDIIDEIFYNAIDNNDVIMSEKN